jgi:hypothetical protein
VNPVNLVDKLATFSEHWQPRTVGQFNGHDPMVVKVQGEFVYLVAVEGTRPHRASEKLG